MKYSTTPRRPPTPYVRSVQVLEATKLVPDPFDSSRTYYDSWKEWHGAEPKVNIPGANSDHASFIFYLGIPSVNLGFEPDRKLHPTLEGNSYPGYHTGEGKSRRGEN